MDNRGQPNLFVLYGPNAQVLAKSDLGMAARTTQPMGSGRRVDVSGQLSDLNAPISLDIGKSLRE